MHQRRYDLGVHPLGQPVHPRCQYVANIRRQLGPGLIKNVLQATHINPSTVTSLAILGQVIVLSVAPYSS